MYMYNGCNSYLGREAPRPVFRRAEVAVVYASVAAHASEVRE